MNGVGFHFQRRRIAGIVRSYEFGDTYSIVRGDKDGTVLEERIIYMEPTSHMITALRNGAGFDNAMKSGAAR